MYYMCGLKLAEVRAGKEQQVFQTNAFIILWNLLRSGVHWIHYVWGCFLLVLMYCYDCKTWLKTSVYLKILEWDIFLPKIPTCFLFYLIGDIFITVLYVLLLLTLVDFIDSFF